MSLGDDCRTVRETPVDAGEGGEHFYRFLHSGHVLRSLLREFLEEDFLHQVCQHRLSRAQFCLLKLVTAKSDLQVGQLARCLGVSPAASSKNLDKLERMGLVSRETAGHDRRGIVLHASRKGTRLVREYERLKRERLAPVLDELGRDKTELLCDLLEEVCGAMLARADTPRETCLRCTGYYLPHCAFERHHGECALRPQSADEGLEDREVEA
jgi:DNA-binding MarR family transcriptional regulator